MRKLISLVLAAALSCTLLAVPALADEDKNGVVITSAGISMEERPDADIAGEDAAAMADANLDTNVPASAAPSAEQAAIDEEAAGVPTQPEPETPSSIPVQPDPVSPFTDVAVDSPFFNHIYYAYLHDLFRGYADSSFRPEGGMTRAMFVTVLYRLAAQLNQDMTVHTPSSFTDILNSNQEFQTAIHWAAERGIVNGKSPTIFDPNETVSRQQACAIIVRYLRDFLDYDLSSFQEDLNLTDLEQVSEYAREAVAIALRMGLIDAETGEDGQRTFRPWLSASRAVVAKIMSVVTAKLPDLHKILPPPVTPEPETPVTSPSTGGSTGGGGRTGSGGGGTGGGTTPVTPTPTDPTPTEPTHTQEELEEEERVIGYMREFVERYQNYYIPSENVRNCFEALIPTLQAAIAAHDNGAFVDRAYAEAHYSEQALEFRNRYNALTDEEKGQAQQYTLIFANTIRKAEAIASFFGVTADYFG